MQATLTAAPTDLEGVPVAAPDAPRERLAWGFTLGCAVVAAGMVALSRFLSPAPPPPEELGAGSSWSGDPFGETRPLGEADGTPLPFVSPVFVTPALFASASQLFAPAPRVVHAKVATGTIALSGRLPRDVVARILRHGQGRLRKCYEVGLRANPNLAGRVTARLVIDRNGGVSHIADGGSNLPDAAVVSCMVRAMYDISFPQPDRGIVTVVYPLTFSPG